VRNGLLILLIFISLSVVSADTGLKIDELIFIPREYYVGDEVELRIKLNLEDGVNLKAPDSIPESSWISINSLELSDNITKPELRIIFTSYIPGTRSFPSLFLGDTVLNSVKIHTSSLMESTGRDFIGIADQILLPGTRLGLIFLIGFLFIGPMLIILLLGPFRRKISNLIKNGIGRSPSNRLNKILRDLNDQRDGISCRRFYIRLSAAVREYLSRRSEIDFITLTTSDMEINLIKVLGNREYSEKLSDMMKLSDNIKFGKISTDDTRKISDIKLVGNISKYLELKIKSSNKHGSSV
jgi:hypothetical protein